MIKISELFRINLKIPLRHPVNCSCAHYQFIHKYIDFSHFKNIQDLTWAVSPINEQERGWFFCWLIDYEPSNQCQLLVSTFSKSLQVYQWYIVAAWPSSLFFLPFPAK